MPIVAVMLSVRIVNLKIITTTQKTNIEKTLMESASLMEKLFYRHFYWESL